jgi:hypothetical protein
MPPAPPPPQTVPTPNNKHKPNLRKIVKTFLLTLALLIITFIAVRLYQPFCCHDFDLNNLPPPYSDNFPPSLLKSPTPTPISSASNWQTYTNLQYGFSFQYPPDITLKETPFPSIILSRPFTSDPETYDQNFWLNIYVEQKVTKESIDAYFINKFCNSIKQSAYTPNLEVAINNCIKQYQESKQESKIDGRNSIEARNTQYITTSIITVIDDSPNIILFNLGESGEEGAGISSEAIATLNLILSTFHFIDQDQHSGCKNIQSDTQELTFLQAFCMGSMCLGKTKTECESIDVVTSENGFLSETSGKDGTPDCFWIEEAPPLNQCQPKYK